MANKYLMITLKSLYWNIRVLGCSIQKTILGLYHIWWGEKGETFNHKLKQKCNYFNT